MGYAALVHRQAMAPAYGLHEAKALAIDIFLLLLKKLPMIVAIGDDVQSLSTKIDRATEESQK